MHLLSLELENFRSLQNQIIELPRRVTLISGKNGEGKTSILEAVFLLSQAKSFRIARPTELICWSNQVSNMAINGHIVAGDGKRTISYAVKQSRRTIAINGNNVSDAGRFFGQFLALDFTPKDLDLVAGPPAGRRKYLDRLTVMLDRAFIRVLMHYQKALKNRNAVLSKYAKKRVSPSDSDFIREVTAWNKPLIECGYQIVQRRHSVCKELSEYCNDFYRHVANIRAESLEKIHLNYQSKFFDGDRVLSIDELNQRYNDSIERDLRYQSTTFGVHHDDLELMLDTGYGLKSARNTASQGQLKSFALALKLAGKDVVYDLTKEYPVLLLDDVESELDPIRRDALFELVSSVNNQVIITATDVSDSAKRFFGELDIRELRKGVLQNHLLPL